MSKPVHFRATDVDVKRLTELMNKLGTTLTAVIREAVRLFHKKEVQNVNKIIFIVALCLTASSCGGAFAQTQPPNIFNGRYLFRSELHTVNAAPPFVEGGILYADGHGRIFVSFTTYNNGSGYVTSPNTGATGSYSIDSLGFGTITMDWVSGSFATTEHFFCQLSGDYCTIVSSEPGRAWQGKMWKDKSTFTVSILTGSYIFESDGALNQFAESGVITFGSGGAYMLASIYNVALHPEVSNLTSPTPAFTCGVTAPMNYYGQPAIFEATQGQCPSTIGMDAFAIYCFFDGSMCILVPDQSGAGWIAEMRKQ